MKILLLDTCGATGSIALASDGKVKAERVLAERSAAATLQPALREMLAEQGVTLAEMDAIAVVTGPGSFTGVRIGVSAAKGLSVGAGVPVIAVSRLAVLAQRCEGERVHAVLDAGRGEFYMGSYAGELREAMLRREELMALIAAKPGTVCVCEAKVVESLKDLKPMMVAEPKAADALMLAMAAWESKEFADVARLDANYLRRAEVEMLEKQREAAARR